MAPHTLIKITRTLGCKPHWATKTPKPAGIFALALYIGQKSKPELTPFYFNLMVAVLD